MLSNEVDAARVCRGERPRSHSSEVATDDDSCNDRQLESAAANGHGLIRAVESGLRCSPAPGLPRRTAAASFKPDDAGSGCRRHRRLSRRTAAASFEAMSLVPFRDRPRRPPRRTAAASFEHFFSVRTGARYRRSAAANGRGLIPSRLMVCKVQPETGKSAAANGRRLIRATSQASDLSTGYEVCRRERPRSHSSSTVATAFAPPSRLLPGRTAAASFEHDALRRGEQFGIRLPRRTAAASFERVSVPRHSSAERACRGEHPRPHSNYPIWSLCAVRSSVCRGEQPRPHSSSPSVS